ncbi:unnamed protein product [Adineta steineri]|uniref:DNA polymerase n=3 Tax=Adineta steineri TaxID=433720 RepID=A0A814MVH5_9BILA|nr:unnamed protein product [Adineta steineri]CAF3484497.1 unnamed protein product [Adineta steineri]
MSVTNNFKRKSFAGQNASAAPSSNGGTQVKRPKRANDDDEDDFMDDPAFDDADPENKENVIEIGQGPGYEITNVKWSRPDIPPINSATDKLVFQQIDLDTYTDTDGTPHILDKSRPHVRGHNTVIRLYGVTDEGYSVMAHLHGYIPYFYVNMPSDSFTTADCERYKQNFQAALRSELRGKDVIHGDVVLSVEIEQKASVYGYQPNSKQNKVLKISVLLPRFIATSRRILEGGFSWTGNQTQISGYKTYETNIDFEIRLMADLHIVGCNWIEIPAGKYSIRQMLTRGMVGQQLKLHSRCQIELDIWAQDIISYPTEGEWQRIAPLRIMSYDIECAGRKGIFPEPEHDPVIQIASMVIRQGDKEEFIKTVFTLGTCANIAGVGVIECKTEHELLEKWADFLREVDPDIITGYNVQNFDFSYLLARAKHLNVPTFSYLGRLKDVKTTARAIVIQSKQMGRRENKQINLEGRILFDLLLVLLREYKLRSYTLNAVSYHFLQQQKEDVQHSIITDLQNGNAQTRHRLAVYCLKDAFLPLRLLEKLMCLINYMEMARVTGVPMNYLLQRGQQIKVISQILRKCKEKNLLIPAMKIMDNGDDYTGATVIEPIRGYYDTPITTLDFSSLYPSIMQAHNLCYSTLITDGRIKQTLSEDDYITTPSGNCFVKSTVYCGILPEILTNLLTARKRAKQMMKEETDEFRKKVLDGRQLALKISANSVYGFTGAQVGKLPCLEISQSVTSFGREMIEKTKALVENEYTIAKGHEHNAQVIYGDTDSVMIKFGVKTLEEAMELGRLAATFVSSHFISPIKLEFEKCYYPYLLINKKRYAGLYFTRPEKYDKMDCKGIETVRRDNCELVASLITTCLEKLLIERDPNGAVEYVKTVISDLLCNRIDISQLVISKELTKTDAEYSNKQPHAELANKMRKRDPGSAPNLGDRVPYVIIPGTKNQPASERAEDPVYVLDNNVPIDTKYYLEQQISKPLLRIFEPILGDSKAESILLRGEHTTVKTVVTSKVGGLAGFITKKDKCIGCKTVLQEQGTALCSYCKAKEGDYYQKEVETLQELEEKFTRLWTECQRCQGARLEDVLCTNRDCSIFYMRRKVQKDLGDQTRIISRFSVPALNW